MTTFWFFIFFLFFLSSSPELLCLPPCPRIRGKLSKGTICQGVGRMLGKGVPLPPRLELMVRSPHPRVRHPRTEENKILPPALLQGLLIGWIWLKAGVQVTHRVVFQSPQWEELGMLSGFLYRHTGPECWGDFKDKSLFLCGKATLVNRGVTTRALVMPSMTNQTWLDLMCLPPCPHHGSAESASITYTTCLNGCHHQALAGGLFSIINLLGHL